MTLTATYKKAAKHLAKDTRLKPVIDRVGVCTLQPKFEEPFTMLVRCVIAQQISGKAADSISGKLNARLKNRVSATTLAKLTDDDLRACGISGPKQRALRSIVQHVNDNKKFLKSMPDMADDVFIEEVTRIKGIGPWSADMMLMFGFGRMDVLPVGDYGLQTGVRDLYELDALPKAAQLEVIAENWRPYRSIATWYIWRSKGPVPNSD